MKKRMLAALLTISTAAALTACGTSNTDTKTTATEAQTQTSAASTEAETQTEAAAQSDTSETVTEAEAQSDASTEAQLESELTQAAADAGISLPISDEKITLRFWYPIGAENLGTMKDYNDNEVFQKMEELTNIHIEWINPVSGTEQESFNLMFASNDLPDLLYTSNKYQYSAGPDAAIEDGYYLDLTDLAETYAPNYMSIVNADPQLQKLTVTDSGKRWGFNYIYKGGRLGNYGPAIRKDLLDQVGKEVPVTYDDWYDVLKAFKTELGIESPFYMYYDSTNQNNSFLAGYNTARAFFQEDGVVKYGPIESGFEEYISMLAKWYSEGLIDPNFSVRTGDVPEDELVLNDKIAAWETFASWCGTSYYPSRGAKNENFNLVAAPIPVKNVGDETHLRNRDLLVNSMSIAISAKTKYPTEAIQWMDYFYSVDGTLMANYGLREGESYIIQDDGTYKWGELITNNPDGLTQNEARTKYTTLNAFYEDYTRVTSSWSDEQKAAQDVWVASKDDGVIPNEMTMTADENQTYASIMSEIQTFVDEQAVKMIMGTSSMSFDDFVQEVKAMGIDEAIEIYQNAFDRYNNR